MKYTSVPVSAELSLSCAMCDIILVKHGKPFAY